MFNKTVWHEIIIYVEESFTHKTEREEKEADDGTALAKESKAEIETVNNNFRQRRQSKERNYFQLFNQIVM